MWYYAKSLSIFKKSFSLCGRGSAPSFPLVWVKLCHSLIALVCFQMQKPSSRYEIIFPIVHQAYNTIKCLLKMVHLSPLFYMEKKKSIHNHYWENVTKLKLKNFCWNTFKISKDDFIFMCKLWKNASWL